MGQQGQKDADRFAVGFSYSGEGRALVAPLAEELARRCGRQRVLFDRFHKAELARPDLDLYLPRLYRDDTELIVVLLSPTIQTSAGAAWSGAEFASSSSPTPKSGSCCCGWVILANFPSWSF
ncbi:MAG: hypothetical protein WCP63_02805 [Cyanobium sp. ELA712]